jgi:hypothetical protein
MAEIEAEAVKRRRRRSSSRKKKAATWPEYWRGPEFGRHLFVAMTLAAVAYAGSILWDIRRESFIYDALWLGASEHEVRYMLGTPEAVEAGGSVYRYADTGRALTVRLSPDGRTESIGCAAAGSGPPTCSKVHGIGIGTTEDVVLLKLGTPSRVTFSGNEKTLHYDGMGLSLTLSLFKVRTIEVRDGASLIGYLPRALWAMLP